MPEYVQGGVTVNATALALINYLPREEPMRCPSCGVSEGELIEEELPCPNLSWAGDIQGVSLVKVITHEAYFNSVEGASGETEYICSECRGRFSYPEVSP